MRKTTYYLLLFTFIMVIISCNENDEDVSPEDTSLIFHAFFEDQSDLNQWNQNSGGQATLEDASVKLVAETDCYHFETRDLIEVQKEHQYSLKVWGKRAADQQGDHLLCSGYFIVYVFQGDDFILSQSFGDYQQWTERNFTFVTATSEPISIRFLIGSTRGAWIREIELRDAA